jgi:hypothetical protein
VNGVEGQAPFNTCPIYRKVHLTLTDKHFSFIIEEHEKRFLHKSEAVGLRAFRLKYGDDMKVQCYEGSMYEGSIMKVQL